MSVRVELPRVKKLAADGTSDLLISVLGAGGLGDGHPIARRVSVGIDGIRREDFVAHRAYILFFAVFGTRRLGGPYPFAAVSVRVRIFGIDKRSADRTPQLVVTAFGTGRFIDHFPVPRRVSVGIDGIRREDFVAHRAYILFFAVFGTRRLGGPYPFAAVSVRVRIFGIDKRSADRTPQLVVTAFGTGRFIDHFPVPRRVSVGIDGIRREDFVAHRAYILFFAVFGTRRLADGHPFAGVSVGVRILGIDKRSADRTPQLVVTAFGTGRFIDHFPVPRRVSVGIDGIRREDFVAHRAYILFFAVFGTRRLADGHPFAGMPVGIDIFLTQYFETSRTVPYRKPRVCTVRLDGDRPHRIGVTGRVKFFGVAVAANHARIFDVTVFRAGSGISIGAVNMVGVVFGREVNDHVLFDPGGIIIIDTKRIRTVLRELICIEPE